MKIFITGATGLIGSHLAEQLSKQGHSIKCLVRESSNISFLSSLNTEIIVDDITSSNHLKEYLEGSDIVYHCAAAVGEWISKKEAYAVNIRGTINILQASLDAKVKRFIYLSSLAVLGMRHHYRTPTDAPYDLTGDIYSDTKIESEKIVIDYYQKGLPVVIIRPGYVFGARDRRFVPRLIQLLKEGKFMFLGDGSNIMNLGYIDNIIEILIKAADNPKAVGSKYNLTNKDKLTMREYVYTICDILGMERPRKVIPVFFAKIVAAVLEVACKMIGTNTPPRITKARIKIASLNLDFDISKTIEDFDYTCKVSLKTGLERTIKALNL